MTRPTWDEYFLTIAQAASTRSDCERDKVGAVLVKDRRVRATGYNGAPAGKPGCATCPRRTSDVEPGSDYDRGPGRCVALHAEQNCVIFADRDDLVGATLYVTRAPCASCSKLISGTGVAKIIWPDGLALL